MQSTATMHCFLFISSLALLMLGGSWSAPWTATTVHAAVVPYQRASIQVGIPISRTRSHASQATATAGPNEQLASSSKPGTPFPLGTFQVDPFHTITFRADHSALIAAQQLCFQQSDCSAITFAGSWSFSPDSQQLRVATTSPIASAMQWQVVAAPASSNGVLKMKVVPGSEEGDFPIEPRLNGSSSVGVSTLRTLGRASVDGNESSSNDDDLREGEEPWMYIEGP